MNEIKLDQETLPAEDTYVDFQLKGSLEWKRDGLFVMADQLFWMSSSEFYSAWDVLFWVRSVEERV